MANTFIVNQALALIIHVPQMPAVQVRLTYPSLVLTDGASSEKLAGKVRSCMFCHTLIKPTNGIQQQEVDALVAKQKSSDTFGGVLYVELKTQKCFLFPAAGEVEEDLLGALAVSSKVTPWTE